VYLGRFTLGQWVPLTAIATTGAMTPGWPAAAPVFSVYDGAGGRVLSGTMPPLDLARLVGSFAYLLRMNSAFDAGHYLATITFTLGGTPYSVENRWEVVAGGNADGGLVSLHHYQRPHATFILGRLDSDQRYIARNPEE
jgi:hypothetical protein